MANLQKRYWVKEDLSYEFDKELAFKYITMDKKSIGDFINIVYCESIGAFEILKIHKDEIKKLLGGSNE